MGTPPVFDPAPYYGSDVVVVIVAVLLLAIVVMIGY